MTHSGTTFSDLNATVDNVTFASYAYNRSLFPKISPERWAKIYGPTEEMEKKYQQSLESYTIYDKVRDEAIND
jgi:hypothetical protein